MLTLWAYSRYAEQSVVSSQWSVASSQASKTPATDDGQRTTDYGPRSTQHAILYYLLCLCFYALGLMSKPMVMTVPFVLLLLDYWPLGRWQVENPKLTMKNLLPLVREKLPFFGLTVASCAITYAWARHSGNLLPAGKEPWGLRLANVPVSYARYLGKMIWPTGLIVPYPMPSHWAWWQVGGAVLVLVVITLWVVRRARSAPYLIVGWLMFLGVLVPTIRLVHSGYQSIADRYMYLPSIGLFMAVVWAAAEWGGQRLRSGLRLGLGGGVAGVGLLLCGYLTWVQAGNWRNNFTLWTHCLAVCADNDLAHYNLGTALLLKGSVDEAITHFQIGLQRQPSNAKVLNNLGIALLRKGRVDEAIAQYQKALEINPNYAEAQNDLGLALLQKGRVDEAIAQYQKALQLKPDLADAYGNLGNALLQKGETAEAIAQYEKALEVRPDLAKAHYNLGTVLLQQGKVDEAIAHFQTALQIKPDYAEAYGNLGTALLQKGKVDEAIAQYRKALQIKFDNAEAHNNLGTALLQKGSRAEAIIQFQQALQIAPADPKDPKQPGPASGHLSGGVAAQRQSGGGTGPAGQ